MQNLGKPKPQPLQHQMRRSQCKEHTNRACCVSHANRACCMSHANRACCVTCYVSHYLKSLNILSCGENGTIIASINCTIEKKITHTVTDDDMQQVCGEFQSLQPMVCQRLVDRILPYD